MFIPSNESPYSSLRSSGTAGEVAWAREDGPAVGVPAGFIERPNIEGAGAFDPPGGVVGFDPNNSFGRRVGTVTGGAIGEGDGDWDAAFCPNRPPLEVVGVGGVTG